MLFVIMANKAAVAGLGGGNETAPLPPPPVEPFGAFPPPTPPPFALLLPFACEPEWIAPPISGVSPVRKDEPPNEES